MKDAEWWKQCTDNLAMLNLVAGGVSHRKDRVFLVACCRSIWHLLVHEGSREAVETAERYADGEVTEGELEDARSGLGHDPESEALDVVYETTLSTDEWQRLDLEAGGFKAVSAALADIQDEVAWKAAQAEKAAAQADLIRCVFGLLPSSGICGDPRWRTSLVLSLAQAAYEERIPPDPTRPGWLVLDPARLLVLADALEEAGADDPDLIGHLRGPGPHVRGCFAVDLCLGHT